MPITIAGTQFRRGACDGCGAREQTTRRCLDVWLCLTCLTHERWYAALSSSTRREIANGYAHAFIAFERQTAEQRADRLLLRSFSPARWAALEAGGV